MRPADTRWRRALRRQAEVAQTRMPRTGSITRLAWRILASQPTTREKFRSVLAARSITVQVCGIGTKRIFLLGLLWLGPLIREKDGSQRYSARKISFLFVP